MAIWSAIFDWDGVIVDSSRQHEEAWHRIAREEERPVPAGFFRRSFGMKNDKVLLELLAWSTDPKEIERLSSRKEEIFRGIVASEKKLTPLPGVLSFLKQLKAGGVPCAVASSTPRPNIEYTIETLGAGEFFRAMVCAEDVRRGKPDPEVFLLAASKLQAAPAQCVVFEDAHVGIEAARKAGMKVVAVATTHSAETLQDADRVVARLDELEVADLNAWFR
jgi:beta-phosphoglucomutase family hydrolase